MGEEQVSMKVKRHILPPAFPAANKNIRCFGGVPVGVGIVDREEGYVD